MPTLAYIKSEITKHVLFNDTLSRLKTLRLRYIRVVVQHMYDEDQIEASGLRY
jgi:hypothetical protein